MYELQYEIVEMLPENTLQLQLKQPNKDGASFYAIVLSIANIVSSLYPLYFIAL